MLPNLGVAHCQFRSEFNLAVVIIHRLVVQRSEHQLFVVIPVMDANPQPLTAVSYTHLDVYKRQLPKGHGALTLL